MIVLEYQPQAGRDAQPVALVGKAITFDKAGDYEYYCAVHPNMVARLTVR